MRGNSPSKTSTLQDLDRYVKEPRYKGMKAPVSAATSSVFQGCRAAVASMQGLKAPVSRGPHCCLVLRGHRVARASNAHVLLCLLGCWASTA